MTGHSLADIAQALGAQTDGDHSIIVRGLAEPQSAGKDDLAVAMDAKFQDGLEKTSAKAAIISDEVDWRSYGLRGAIIVNRPRLALVGLTATFTDRFNGLPATIHPSSIIDQSAEIGPNARIGAFVTIGPNSRIGPDCLIAPGVHIGANVSIGARAILHSGVVIGGDGFSFVTEEKSAVEEVKEFLGDAGINTSQSWLKIHSLGGVTIGDDVEIGANSSVDAGTLRPTRIGDGTKLDSLVQVGHNVEIGENCLLCAHVAVGGSAILGNNVVLGGQVGIADNISVGDGVVAGGASKVLSNVPKGRAILGYPAVKMENHVEMYKIQRRLPQILKKLDELRKMLGK